MSPREANAVLEYLQQFSNAQRIRTQQYKKLETGFQDMLHSHNEAAYK